MKTGSKLLIWLPLLLVLPLNLFSQTKVIELDFKNKFFSKNKDSISNPYNLDIKEGDLYQVKITGINLNLYNVSITNKDTTINSNVDFPSFEMVGLDGLQKLLGNLTELKTFAQVLEESSIDSRRFKLLPMKDQEKLIKENVEDALERNKIFELKKNDEEISEINNNINYLKEQNLKLIGINIKIDSLNLKVQTQYLRYLTNNDSIKKTLNNINFKDIIQKSEYYRSYIKNIIKNIEDKLHYYTEFYNKHQSSIDADSTLKKKDLELKKAFSSSINETYNVYQSINANSVIKWLSSVINLANNDGEDYTSLPLQLKGDETTLKINIEPKNNAFGLSKYSTEIKFPSNKRFYLGSGISFYASTLYDDSYSIKATVIDTTTNYSIVNEKSKKKEVGIASLLHFGWKFNNCDFGLHGSIGPAISISTTVKPRLSIGAGISYGKKQKLTLDFLVMAGYVDRRSNVYSENQDYSLKPDHVTVSKLQFGGSIAFGYIYKF